MTKQAPFRTPTAAAVWRESWCDRCFQPDEVNLREHGRGTGCPILARAARTQRKPPEWDRNPRATTMDSVFKCTAFLDQPPVLRRASVDDGTASLFDVTPTEGRSLIPVDGWPEYQAGDAKPRKGEHS